MQIFYDPNTGQVMAVYKNCRYKGTAWQNRGYKEAESEIDVTRDHKVKVKNGQVTAATPNPNPVQPKEKPREKDKADKLADKLIEKGLLTREEIKELLT